MKNDNSNLNKNIDNEDDIILKNNLNNNNINDMLIDSDTIHEMFIPPNAIDSIQIHDNIEYKCNNVETVVNE